MSFMVGWLGPVIHRIVLWDGLEEVVSCAMFRSSGGSCGMNFLGTVQRSKLLRLAWLVVVCAFKTRRQRWLLHSLLLEHTPSIR